MLRSGSVEDMAVAGMEEGEDSTAEAADPMAEAAGFTVVVAGFTVVGEDSVAAEDSGEDRADFTAEEGFAVVRATADLAATEDLVAGMRMAATEDLAAGRIAEDLARADLAEDRSAADLDREALPERIEVLAADARAWDGVSGAWAGVSAGDLEMRNELRMFRERLRMGGGMDSETAGG